MLLFESSMSSAFWNVLSYSVIRAYFVSDFEKCTTLFHYFSLLCYLELQNIQHVNQIWHNDLWDPMNNINQYQVSESVSEWVSEWVGEKILRKISCEWSPILESGYLGNAQKYSVKYTWTIWFVRKKHSYVSC